MRLVTPLILSLIATVAHCVSTEHRDHLADPCAGIACPENGICSAADDGACRMVCASGFVAATSADGGAQQHRCIADPCAQAQCPENARCSPVVGADRASVECRAFCRDGFEMDAARGVCVSRDPCAAVKCPADADCVPAEGGKCRAVCRSGFVPNASGSGCEAVAGKGTGACEGVACPEGMTCTDVGGDCIGHCAEGYSVDRENNKCVRIAASRTPRLCPVGYAPDAEGKKCFPVNPCALFKECPANAVCENVNGQCFVACKAGYGIDYLTRTCQPLEVAVN